VSILYHDDTVYARLETLQLNVRNPSPAMQAWVETDDRWREARDQLAMAGGASIDECAAWADNRCARRAGGAA
jgi:hypothetical protein